MQSAKPVITDGLKYGSHLLEDDVIDEDNKAKIRRDVHHLEEDLVKMEQANDDEHKRCHLKSNEVHYMNTIPLAFFLWFDPTYRFLSFL